MGNRELDAQVAVEVMGSKVLYDNFGSPGVQGKNGWLIPLPRYHKSHDAVATVRAEIERRGLARQFINHLYSELIDGGLDNSQNSGAWAILNATPEAQCRAARAAVKAAQL